MFHVKPINNNFILYIIYEQKLISKNISYKNRQKLFPGKYFTKIKISTDKNKQ